MPLNQILRQAAFIAFVTAPLLMSAQVRGADIATATAEQRQSVSMRYLEGTVEAINQSTLSSQVSARVEKIHYDVGDYVKKDAVLIEFRDREVRAAYDEARARFEEAEDEYKRIKDLIDKKLVSRSQLDKAEAQFKSTRARLQQAQENLNNTRVRAPYSGIVVKRHVEMGELANVGQPLMTGLSLEALRVNVDAPQDMIQPIQQYQQAFVKLPDGRQVQASSLTINPYADPKSHTFNIRVNLPQQDLELYPGMLIKTGFVTGQTERLTVPVEAVARRSEVTAVYVLGQNGRLEFRQIRVGQRSTDGQHIEILSGLQAGEQVLLDPVKAAIQLKSGNTGS